MGKKPELPPIDLSAKKVIVAKAPEPAAPPIATTPAAITPANSNGAIGSTTPVEEAVRVGAYYRWDAAGRPGGDGVHFWLEAEQEIMAGGASVAQESLHKQ
jgi:hypothetical protein